MPKLLHWTESLQFETILQVLSSLLFHFLIKIQSLEVPSESYFALDIVLFFYVSGNLALLLIFILLNVIVNV